MDPDKIMSEVELLANIRDHITGMNSLQIPMRGFRAGRSVASSRSLEGTFQVTESDDDADPHYDPDLEATLHAELTEPMEHAISPDAFLSGIDALAALVRDVGSTTLQSWGTKGTMSTITQDLYPHQLVGVAQLEQMLKSMLKGAIIGDGVGSGKTRLALAVMHKMQVDGPDALPILIIAPKSTAGQWESEARLIRKDDQELTVLRLTTYVHPLKVRQYDAVIVTLEKIRSEFTSLRKYILSYGVTDQGSTQAMPAPPQLSILSKLHRQAGGFLTIVDEVHRAKSPFKASLSALRLVPRAYTLMLSGTVLDNTWADVYAPLSLLRGHPWVLKSAFDAAFASRKPRDEMADGYDVISQYGQTPQQRSMLIRVLRGVLLRRHPADLRRANLIQVIDEHIELTGSEKACSDMHFESWQRIKSSGAGWGQFHLARAHATHPALANASTVERSSIADNEDEWGYDDEEDERVKTDKVSEQAFDEQINSCGGPLGSSKMKAFRRLFEQNYKCHRIIVTAEQVRLLHIATRVVKEEFPAVQVYQFFGKTTAKERNSILSDFQKSRPGTAVLMLSHKAGGTGTNINASDLMIQLEVCWNKNAERQVHGRICREKKATRPTVYRLVASNALVDTHLVNRQESKVSYCDDIIAEVEVKGRYAWENA